MLGVFQKLVASKANDVFGFMLLRGILEHLPLSAYQQYMPTVWQLLFTRLQVGWWAQFPAQQAMQPTTQAAVASIST
jgi:exportin-2 (importin alpha re-exporter)